MSINAIMPEAAEEKKNGNISVQIFGADYPVMGAQDPQYVQELARYVDAKMRDIAKGSALLSASKVAILAALNITDELFRCRASRQELCTAAVQTLGEMAKKIDRHLEK